MLRQSRVADRAHCLDAFLDLSHAGQILVQFGFIIAADPSTQAGRLIAHAVEEMGLDEDRIEAVYQEAVRRGITLADDWKRDEAPEGTYTPELFAEATSDSLCTCFWSLGRTSKTSIRSTHSICASSRRKRSRGLDSLSLTRVLPSAVRPAGRRAP